MSKKSSGKPKVITPTYSGLQAHELPKNCVWVSVNGPVAVVLDRHVFYQYSDLKDYYQEHLPSDKEYSDERFHAYIQGLERVTQVSIFCSVLRHHTKAPVPAISYLGKLVTTPDPGWTKLDIKK